MTKKKTKPRIRPSLDYAEQRCYEVSYEPVSDQKFKLLPEAVQQELNELHARLESAPQAVLPRLLELKQQYPRTPLLYNFVSVAYGGVDRQKQKQAIMENYRLHPNYLFARCHYAELCLQEGKPEKIPEVFDRAFDLKTLYPRRNRFHISEYSAFAAVLCKYYHAIGEREQAEALLQSLKQMAQHDAVVKRLEALLHPGWLRRSVMRFVAALGK